LKADNSKESSKVILSGTMLRDSERLAGVFFLTEERVRIAKALNAANAQSMKSALRNRRRAMALSPTGSQA
jgi:hypothetical protein